MKQFQKSEYIKKYGFFQGRKLYKKFQTGDTATLKLTSLKYPIHMQPNSIDNCSFREIFFDDEYVFEYPNFGKKEMVIIDAGANIGFASVFFKNKFPNSKIIAIEPEIENFKWLQKNTEKYRDISILKGGLWDKDSNLLVTLEEGRSTRAFMLEEVEEKNDNTISGYSVKTIMNKFEIEKIDIFKIDIEGSEKELFENNYEYWLPKTKCLIVETHDRMKSGCTDAILNTINKYNFDSFESGENIVFINKDI